MATCYSSDLDESTNLKLRRAQAACSCARSESLFDDLHHVTNCREAFVQKGVFVLNMMSKKQLLSLCLCNSVLYAGIGGLVGLMPLYLVQLGADLSLTGFFLASVYLALALSTLLGGWLADRFQRRTTFLILGGLGMAPIAWFMSQATTIGTLWGTMGALWFVLGIPLTMIATVTGLFAKAGHRGRSFGMLALSANFGLFVGGWISGSLVDRGGFPLLFAVFAGLYLLVPAAGWFVEDAAAVAPQAQNSTNQGRMSSSFHNRTFCLLFVASICAQAANIMIFLTRPLMMNALHFDATTISRMSAVGGLFTLPLPLFLGWLTDKIGRKSILIACLLAPMLGLIVQIGAVSPWHFLLSSLLSTIVGASTAVGLALITDLLGNERLGSPLAWLNATPWIGIVLGLSIGGSAIRAFQIIPALVGATLLSLIAVWLLVPVSERMPKLLSEQNEMKASS